MVRTLMWCILFVTSLLAGCAEVIGDVRVSSDTKTAGEKIAGVTVHISSDVPLIDRERLERAIADSQSKCLAEIETIAVAVNLVLIAGINTDSMANTVCVYSTFMIEILKDEGIAGLEPEFNRNGSALLIKEIEPEPTGLAI